MIKDDFSNNSSLCDDVEECIVIHEASENITNKSISVTIPLEQDKQVKEVQADFDKNTEYGPLRKRKLHRKKQFSKKNKFVCDDCGFASKVKI